MKEKAFKGRVKMLLVIFVLQILFSSFTFFSREVRADGVTEFSLSTANGGSEFWTGESVIYNVDVILSGVDPTINEPTIEIRFPVDFIDSVTASDINSQTSKTIVNTGTEYVITYKFNQIPGGASLRIPIEVKTNNGNTPDGYSFNMTGTIFDNTGGEIANSNALETTFKTFKPMLYKGVLPDNQISPIVPTLYGGKEDPNNPGYISSDVADTVPITFTYAIGGTGSGLPAVGTGNRIYSDTIIEDYVPVGAVFIASENPGWTYNPSTRIASYDYSGDRTYNIYNRRNFTGVQLKLRFPGFATDAISNVANTNEAKAILTPLNMEPYEVKLEPTSSIDFKLTSSIEVKDYLVGKVPTNNNIILDNMDRKSKEYGYRLYLRNNEQGANLENFILTDLNLDSRLKFSRLEIPASTAISGTVSIEVVDGGGAVTTLATGVSLSSTYSVNIPDGVVKINIKGDISSFIKDNKTFDAYVYFVFKDPENTTTDVTSDMRNSLNTSGYYVGISDKIEVNTSSKYIFVPYNPKIYVGKARTSTDSNYFVGEEVSYYIRGLMRKVEEVAVGDKIESPIVMDLLPVGSSYVTGSSVVTYNQSNITGQSDFITPEPEVINNYAGTGRTALIWHFTSDINGFGGNYGTAELYRIDYRTTVSYQSIEGVNRNNAYMIWDNNEEITTSGTSTTDDMDIDNDGDVTEVISTTSAVFNYVPPREVITTKLVKGSLDNMSVTTPNDGKSEIDSNSTYTLRIYNNSITDISYLSIVDELPFVGDTASSPDSNGIYQPRGSEYQVKLTGPIDTPVGFMPYYTTDSLNGDINNYYDNANWVTSVSDYSTVKGIKIVMMTGHTLLQGESVDIDLNISVPYDMALDNEAVSFNSFATTLTGTSFFESNSVGLGIVKYSVEGNIFNDINEDGIYQSGSDKDITNYLVTLVDENGYVVNDLEGNPITTNTDDSGYYQMDVYREGTYRIKVEVIDGYRNTSYVSQSIDPMGSNIEPNTTFNNEFSTDIILTAKNPSAIRNAGYIYDLSDLLVNKELYNSSDEVIDELRTFDYILTVNGSLYEGEATIKDSSNNETSIDIVNGEVSFKNSEVLIIRGLSKEAEIVLEEVNSDNYTTDPEDKVYEETLEVGDNEYIFKNTEKDNGVLTISKNLLDEDGNDIDESRDFIVRITGPSYPNGEEFTLNSLTPLVIDDLIYGDYVIEELDADTDYDISITGSGLINALNNEKEIVVTNKGKPLASIEGIYFIDTNKDGIRDILEPIVSGAKVELLDSEGNVIGETTTGEGGRYVFDDLVPGTYVVKFYLEDGSSYEFTLTDVGSDDSIDSDANRESGLTDNISLNYGDNVKNIDVGVILIEKPNILILKSVDEKRATPGDIVHYVLEVINTGNVDLSDVTLTDDKIGVIEHVVGELKVGESKVFTYKEIPELAYKIPEDFNGKFDNIAVTKGTSNIDPEEEVTHEDDTSTNIVTAKITKLPKTGENVMLLAGLVAIIGGLLSIVFIRKNSNKTSK